MKNLKHLSNTSVAKPSVWARIKENTNKLEDRARELLKETSITEHDFQMLMLSMWFLTDKILKDYGFESCYGSGDDMPLIVYVKDKK